MRCNSARLGQWLLAGCLIVGPAVSWAAEGLVFRGLARDLDSGQPLYREAHFISQPGSAREVRIVHYQCAANGAVFARKELDYAASRERPSFTLIDRLAGYSEGLRLLPGGRAQVFNVSGPGRDERQAVLPANKTIVADAGFDEFLKRRWAELERGDSVRFSFLIPSRLTAAEFRVTKHRDEIIDGTPASVIRMSLTGVIGWLLPYIEVSYRQSDRALLRYRGLTNLRNSAGDNFTAVVEFPTAERRTASIDLAALRVVPLVSRCP